MKPKLYFVATGIGIALLAFFLGDRFPPLAYLNVPGFFAWFVLSNPGHNFGKTYLVGGLVLNSLFYSLIFFGIAKLISWLHARKNLEQVARS